MARRRSAGRLVAVEGTRGEDVAAARMAVALGNDFLDFRGDAAVANGWFKRARRLLEPLPPSAVHARLSVWEARLAPDELRLLAPLTLLTAKPVLYAANVTDACIDWDSTEKTLRSMHAKLKDVLPKRRRG